VGSFDRPRYPDYALKSGDPLVFSMTSRSLETRSDPRLERLRALAQLMDGGLGVPGTRFRFGLDPIIGLIPGIGDAIGAIVSVFIVFQAARLGTPKATLVRMMSNIGLDTIVGEIPLLGDLFDFGWKSNLRNIALLEQHLQQPVTAQRTSRRVLLLLALGLLVLLAAVVTLGFWLAKITVVRVS
jgi:uncharacterized protein DUF4112